MACTPKLIEGGHIPNTESIAFSLESHGLISINNLTSSGAFVWRDRPSRVRLSQGILLDVVGIIASMRLISVSANPGILM